MEAENGKMPSTSQDAMTVGEIATTLKRGAWKIALSTIVITALAAGYSFLVGETWKASVRVVPTEVPHSEQLGALAEVLSKKAGTGSANIDLFTALLTSRPVLEKLLVSEVRKPGIDGDTMKSVESQIGINLSDKKSRYYAIDDIAKSISFTQQQSSLSNIVEVSIVAKTDWLAKGMLSNLLEIGQAALFDVTRSRYQTVIPRLERADSVASGKSLAVSEEMTRFQENNRISDYPSVRQKLDRYRQELQIRDQTYLMVRRELEQNRLEMEKIMPPVVAIDSVTVPPLREGPKRTQIMIVGFILGLLGSVAALLILSMMNNKKV